MKFIIEQHMYVIIIHIHVCECINLYLLCTFFVSMKAYEHAFLELIATMVNFYSMSNKKSQNR